MPNGGRRPSRLNHEVPVRRRPPLNRSLLREAVCEAGSYFAAHTYPYRDGVGNLRTDEDSYSNGPSG